MAWQQTAAHPVLDESANKRQSSWQVGYPDMQVQVMQGNPMLISLRGAVVTSDCNEQIGRNHNLHL